MKAFGYLVIVGKGKCEQGIVEWGCSNDWAASGRTFLKGSPSCQKSSCCNRNKSHWQRCVREIKEEGKKLDNPLDRSNGAGSSTHFDRVDKFTCIVGAPSRYYSYSQPLPPPLSKACGCWRACSAGRGRVLCDSSAARDGGWLH